MIIIDNKIIKYVLQDQQSKLEVNHPGERQCLTTVSWSADLSIITLVAT